MVAAVMVALIAAAQLGRFAVAALLGVLWLRFRGHGGVGELGAVR